MSKYSIFVQAFSWCSWLSHPPNTRKVSGSNPDENKLFSFIILQEISEFEHKTSIYHLCALFLRAERGQSLRDTKYDFVDDHLFEWNTCKATLWSTHRLTERGRKKLGVENGVFFVKTHWHNKKESLGDRPCRWEVTLTHFFSA